MACGKSFFSSFIILLLLLLSSLPLDFFFPLIGLFSLHLIFLLVLQQIATIMGQAKTRSLPPQKAVVKNTAPSQNFPYRNKRRFQSRKTKNQSPRQKWGRPLLVYLSKRQSMSMMTKKISCNQQSNFEIVFDVKSYRIWNIDAMETYKGRPGKNHYFPAICHYFRILDFNWKVISSYLNRS